MSSAIKLFVALYGDKLGQNWNRKWPEEIRAQPGMGKKWPGRDKKQRWVGQSAWICLDFGADWIRMSGIAWNNNPESHQALSPLCWYVVASDAWGVVTISMLLGVCRPQGSFWEKIALRKGLFFTKSPYSRVCFSQNRPTQGSVFHQVALRKGLFFRNLTQKCLFLGIFLNKTALFVENTKKLSFAMSEYIET